MLTIGEALRINAAKQPHQLCLADGRRRFSYAEVNARVNRLAHGLLRDGCRPGDCVAVLARNSIEYMELFHACAKLGMRLVTLNFWLRPGEIETLFNHSEATWLVVGAEEQDAVAPVLPRLVALRPGGLIVIGEPRISGARPVEELCAPVEGEPGIEVDWNAPFWMMYTSGTTGDPKGVVRSFERTALCLWFGIIEFAFHRDDMFLAVSPFFHGVNFLPLMVLQVGGAVHVVEEFSAPRVARLLREGGITASFLVPTMLDMLLELVASEPAGASSLRVLVTGGAPLPTPVKEAIVRHYGPVLHEFYGATESGFLTVLHPRDQLRKERCCGQPAFGAEVQIRSELGEVLPPGKIGEIFSRCPGRFDAYFRSPERTAAALHAGWFTAGDLGCVDEEGFVYVVDRKSDIIISGGENIYPREVEDVLRTNPGVAECAVVGVPDTRWGEAVKAFVVPRTPGAVSSEVLVEHCRRRLAGFKCPRLVEFVRELPRTASGKVLKTVLRERHHISIGDS